MKTIYVRPSQFGSWYAPVSNDDKQALYSAADVFQVYPDQWGDVVERLAQWSYRLVLID